MTFTTYPAHLSPYPSDSLVAVRRVDRKDYPAWDGVAIKLGSFGASISWRRR